MERGKEGEGGMKLALEGYLPSGGRICVPILMDRHPVDAPNDIFLLMQAAINTLPSWKDAVFKADQQSILLMEQHAKGQKLSLVGPWQPGQPSMSFCNIPIEIVE